MSARIFYGWWIVIACFLISFYVGGVIFFGFTAFFEPIRQTMRLSLGLAGFKGTPHRIWVLEKSEL